MRLGSFLAVLAALVAAGCSSSASLKDMVGYVPPTSLPAQPKRTFIAEERERVWGRLVNFFQSSAFEIEHIDKEKSLLVARYSGNPHPYIDCGSIVTHQDGALDQIAGSAPTIALQYKVDDESVVLNRLLNLDSRIIISLADHFQGTVIETDTTYIVTKMVDVVDRSGGIREGSRETVSFEAGNRGEFRKGTTCQPNGLLDLAVLQSLPNIVGSDEIERAELTDRGKETTDRVLLDDKYAALSQPPTLKTLTHKQVVTDDQARAIVLDAEGVDAAVNPLPASEGTTEDWLLPEHGLPKAALPVPVPEQPTARSAATTSKQETLVLKRKTERSASDINRSHAEDIGWEGAPLPETRQTVALPPDTPEAIGSPTDEEKPASTIVDGTTRKLLDSLNCGGEEWHFCDFIELTTPYRKRNIDKLFGFTINTAESFASQIIGRDLKLNILFPSFASHLHIVYARRDGSVEHIMSSSDMWPADLAHQLTEEDRVIPGPAGLAMIIAIASERPLFSSSPEGVEDAKVYLDRLKQRLTEFEDESPGGSIAASQLLIYVENVDT